MDDPPDSDELANIFDELIAGWTQDETYWMVLASTLRMDDLGFVPPHYLDGTHEPVAGFRIDFLYPLAPGIWPMPHVGEIERATRSTLVGICRTSDRSYVMGFHY